jgi:peptide/nickel transport system permease protein
MSRHDSLAVGAEGTLTSRVLAAMRRIPWPVLAFVGTCFVLIAFADLLAPHRPDAVDLRMRLTPPAWLEGGTSEHLLGTDDLGRDVLSRLLIGARISLSLSLTAVLIAGVIGVVLGMLAGYVRGAIESIIMRVADAAAAVPLILVALLFMVTLGPGVRNLILALSLLLWARYARVIRSEVLSLRERDFVTFSRISGASAAWVLAKHLLPNVASTVIVLLTLQLGSVIIVEASLSFLGAGVPPPKPAWGTMVADGRNFVSTAWWVSAFPGLAIMLTVLACNLTGDWLRNHLDPGHVR